MLPRYSDENDSEAVKEVAIYHQKISYEEETGQILDAAKWAWACAEELARKFCLLHCVSYQKCSEKADQLDKAFSEGYGSEPPNVDSWEEAQQKFHEALVRLPQIQDVLDDVCPACAVVAAFTIFPDLVDISPVNPVSTVEYTTLTNTGEKGHLRGKPSFPCCTWQEKLPKWQQKTSKHIREKALLHIDLDEIPPLPPEQMSELRRILHPGQEVLSEIHQLKGQLDEGKKGSKTTRAQHKDIGKSPVAKESDVSGTAHATDTSSSREGRQTQDKGTERAERKGKENREKRKQAPHPLKQWAYVLNVRCGENQADVAKKLNDSAEEWADKGGYDVPDAFATARRLRPRFRVRFSHSTDEQGECLGA